MQIYGEIEVWRNTLPRLVAIGDKFTMWHVTTLPTTEQGQGNI